jgi:mxaJ protein
MKKAAWLPSDAICPERDADAATWSQFLRLATIGRGTRLRLKRFVLFVLLALGVVGLARSSAASRRELRVCADGNNLPFSNRARAGFENKLAELLARQLGARVTYTWAAQRRGFVRSTLNAGLCDVIMGVPSGMEGVQTTRPYYRSSYVLVSGPAAPQVDSLNALELRGLKIGVPMVGDDGANPAPLLALAARGLIGNVRGYSVYGDYTTDSPPADLIRAVRRGEIDVAVAWGPLAGYYANQDKPKLRITPLRALEAPPGLSFAFDISVAVRKGDDSLLADLNHALERQHGAVAALLARYFVPVTPR